MSSLHPQRYQGFDPTFATRHHIGLYIRGDMPEMHSTNVPGSCFWRITTQEGYLYLMGRKQLSHGIQTDGKKQRKTNTLKASRQLMHMHLLVRNTWAGPPNSRAGPRNCRAGPYRARVSWALLPFNGPGRAGPGRDFGKNDGPGQAGPCFFKCDGLGRAAAHPLKNWWAGPGHQRRPMTSPDFNQQC